MPMPSPRQISPDLVYLGLLLKPFNGIATFWKSEPSLLLAVHVPPCHFNSSLGCVAQILPRLFQHISTFSTINHHDPCPREQSDPPGLFWPSLGMQVGKGAALLAVVAMFGSAATLMPRGLSCSRLESASGTESRRGPDDTTDPLGEESKYGRRLCMCPLGSNLQTNICSYMLILSHIIQAFFQTHQTAFRVQLSAVMTGERQPRQPNQPEPLAPGTCQPQQGTTTQAGFHALQGISAVSRASIWRRKKSKLWNLWPRFTYWCCIVKFPFSSKAESCTYGEEDIILAFGCWIVREAGISMDLPAGVPKL